MEGYMVDVKGYSVDAKGYSVDVKGYMVDAKGYMVDVKGCSVDDKGLVPVGAAGEVERGDWVLVEARDGLQHRRPLIGHPPVLLRPPPLLLDLGDQKALLPRLPQDLAVHLRSE
eukprot:288117-Prorocentrum_minimum.AAC.1